jgi:hypothetical protein
MLRILPHFAYWRGKGAPLAFKGNVQRKLRWVENGANQWVLALDIIFSFWFTFILFLTYFRIRSVLPNL